MKRNPQVNQRIKLTKKIKNTRPKREGTDRPASKAPGLPRLFEAAFRWSLVVVIFIMIVSGTAVKKSARDDAKGLANELRSMQSERDRLKEERDLFNNPGWSEAYWKWQTMSHKPGEYYIEFVEPGTY